MKAYTAFLFQGYSPEILHCTHKYLGEVSYQTLQEISAHIKLYRSTQNFQPPKVVFDKREMFGENADTPVLVPSVYDLKDFFPNLRAFLGQYRKDDFPEYRPHVTTVLDKVDMPFVSYALIVDGLIYDFWKFGERVLNVKTILLRPVKESPGDYDEIESRIIELFKREIYLPLIKEFSDSARILKNAAKTDLVDAIHSGRVCFNRGTFSGRFNSTISRELKKLGAKWDRKSKTWKIPLSELPLEIRNVISASEFRYQQKITAIDEKLSKIVPQELAEKLKISKLFDATLWKTDREIQSTLAGLTVSPKLTKEQSERIAKEWQTNMHLWIKDFTEKEILKLRADMRATIEAGNRYGEAIDKIKASYGVTQRKAKFLASQETRLLMTKFKETRYQDAGSDEYVWGCVAGTPAHPVRPWHKALEGKTFRWDSPPITTKPGEPARRNNPGQDYNCRCFARPAVRFR